MTSSSPACSSIEELNQVAVTKAEELFDLDNNEFEIQSLFNACKNLLKHAGQFKASEQYERCYVYLVQYLILVMKKLPQHPEVQHHAEELEFYQKKCDQVKLQLSELKKTLIALYEQVGGNDEQESSEDNVEESVENQEKADSMEEADSHMQNNYEQHTIQQYQQQQEESEEKSAPQKHNIEGNMEINNKREESKVNNDNNYSTINCNEILLDKKALMKKMRPLPGIQYPSRIIHSSLTHREFQPKVHYRKVSLTHNTSDWHGTRIYPLTNTIQTKLGVMQLSTQRQRHLVQQHRTQSVQQTPSHVPKYMTPEKQQPTYQGSIQYQQEVIAVNVIDSSIPQMIVNNEHVQQRVGAGVARLAQNEQVQARVADGVANVARNEKVQQQMGDAIASNTDNVLIQHAARNETVQKAVGNALANTVGNKEIQRKAGNAVANMATNREVQKKVASGVLSAGKFGFSATKSLVKGGYEIYKNQE
jgi:hypothetical protein